MSTSSLEMARSTVTWEILDRLGVELERCATAASEVQRTLEAVAEALDADVVFWHSADAAAAQFLGHPALSLPWRCAFLDRVLGPTPGDNLLLEHFLDPAAKPASPWPVSAALVRVHEPAAWLAALRFPPHRLFVAGDAHALMLARRLLVNQRRRATVRVQLQDALSYRVQRLAAAIDDLVREGGPPANARLLENLQACRRDLEFLARAQGESVVKSESKPGLPPS